VSRHLAKDPLLVEFARSDPTLNRPYYTGRAADLLRPETAAIVRLVCSLLSISLVPYLAARWRAAWIAIFERPGFAWPHDHSRVAIPDAPASSSCATSTLIAKVPAGGERPTTTAQKCVSVGRSRDSLADSGPP